MTNSNHIPRDRRDEALSLVPAEEKARLGDIWDLVAAADESPNISDGEIEQTWQNLSSFAQSHSDADIAHQPKPELRLITSRRVWISVAATLLLGVVGAGWWMQPVRVQVPEGQQFALNLPDGSHVTLNSGSSLTYARSFEDTRDVHLEGEAFFEITPSPIPFVLTTFNANVRVLGTKFNVKAWESSVAPATVVSLTEGSVHFGPTNNANASAGVVMKPGERRTLPMGSREISPSDTVTMSYVTAWKEGNLVFKDEWLGVILEDIERRFAIDIDLKSNALLQKEFTFVSRQPQAAEAVINSLCEALGLRYSQTAQGVVIYQASD